MPKIEGGYENTLGVCKDKIIPRQAEMAAKSIFMN
jgi:hypothetical protein